MKIKTYFKLCVRVLLSFFILISIVTKYWNENKWPFQPYILKCIIGITKFIPIKKEMGMKTKYSFAFPIPTYQI